MKIKSVITSIILAAVFLMPYAANAATLDGYTNWRTLKADLSGINELSYIFTERKTGITINTSEKNAKYTMATINKTTLSDATGVNGVILFPDSYVGPTEDVENIITFGTINDKSAWTTKCTTTGWETLEAAGCVFLPAAGFRQGTSVYSVESYVVHWSSTKGGSTLANYIYFTDNDKTNSQTNRYTGCSVRLVRPL